MGELIRSYIKPMQYPSLRRCALFVVFCFFLNPLSCQLPQRKAADFTALQSKLESDRSRQAYDALQFLLAKQYTDLSTEERKSLRASLEKHAKWSSATLCPDTEPGVKLHLEGRLLNEKNQAVAGAKLHIFHTDSRGYYSPLDSITGRMLEQDPRLDGFLHTDEQGRFSFQTVRPGNYPKKYEGRLLPQHVHVLVYAKGYEVLSVQVAFKDDPAMNAHWIDWAQKAEFPLVQLEKTTSGLRGKFELHLVKK